VNHTGQNRRVYVPMRGIASAASLILAFWYSKELGVLNRSFLAVIMTTSILCSIAFTSGATFTLRALKVNGVSDVLKKSFFTLVAIQGLLAFVTYSVALGIFSQFKDELPRQLILAALVYFIFSLLHLVMMEILLAADKFKRVGQLEVLTVTSQIVLFFGLSFVTHISVASRVLLSLTISYTIICVYVTQILDFKPYLGYSSPKEFWRLTRGRNSLGTVLGILDRADRIIIAWTLPTINTGQYAVMGSILGFFRFIPDAISKIIVSGKISFLVRLVRVKALVILGLILSLVTLTVTSQIVIKYYLGAEWLLPWWISLLFGAQEIARGTFQVIQNERLSKLSGQNSHLHFLLLVTNVSLAFLLSHTLGLVGVPLGFLLGYCLCLIWISRGHRIG
jgi:hypothetical protein